MRNGMNGLEKEVILGGNSPFSVSRPLCNALYFLVFFYKLLILSLAINLHGRKMLNTE